MRRTLSKAMMRPRAGTRDEDLIAQLEQIAMLAWHCTLVGERAPIVTRWYHRMRDPRPGDLVVITMAPREPVTARVGHLISHDMVPIGTEFTHEDDPRRYTTEEQWTIKPLRGPLDEVRWTNCGIVAMPPPGISLDEWR